MLYIILFVLWFVAGVLNLVFDDVSKFDYAMVWLLLLWEYLWRIEKNINGGDDE